METKAIVLCVSTLALVGVFDSRFRHDRTN